MAHEYPVGKTQAMVLNALGLTAYSFQQADELFRERGLIVKSKRVGRGVQPEIIVNPRRSSAWNEDGDADTFRQYVDLDLTPIAHWIVR